ncbi:V-type proton ATPase subunit e 2 [Cloeon dipterum]|uniref:V-type proton ATPase subunit n=1 Tax=Cloeon dipterum TaxID=197152 RepID=A0A8S1DSS2_9INSE|nr:Hypothetical predicted protein [Cloeon dipterum]
MGASIFPIFFFTMVWGGVGIALPRMVPNGPQQRLMQVVLMITGACCWLFWLCCYMAQMNPLIGPRLSNRTLLLIAQQWGNPLERF